MLTITLSFKRSQNKDRFYDNPHSKEHGNSCVVGRVRGDGVAQIRAAALAKGREVFGPDANLAVVSPFILKMCTDEGKPPYYADMTVREILPVEAK